MCLVTNIASVYECYYSLYISVVYWIRQKTYYKTIVSGYLQIIYDNGGISYLSTKQVLSNGKVGLKRSGLETYHYIYSFVWLGDVDKISIFCCKQPGLHDAGRQILKDLPDTSRLSKSYLSRFY